VKCAQWDKPQSIELLVLFICVCRSLCTIVAHNTAQNRPDNFPSCPPENHHCSDDVYLRKRGFLTRKYTVRVWGLLDLWLPTPETYNKQNTVYSIYADTIRYDTIHYIYMHPKLTHSQINLPYGTNKHKEGNGIKLKSPIIKSVESVVRPERGSMVGKICERDIGLSRGWKRERETVIDYKSGELTVRRYRSSRNMQIRDRGTGMWGWRRELGSWFQRPGEAEIIFHIVFASTIASLATMPIANVILHSAHWRH